MNSHALSIEGKRERTDARRGEGVFDKVVAAAEQLRREGVIFGISLTPPRPELRGGSVRRGRGQFFGELGALHAFVFH